VWCARISLLMHLGLFQEAERELVAFEELANPDLYYQYHAHSYPNKTGNHGNNYPCDIIIHFCCISKLINNVMSASKQKKIYSDM
jgi:hypothetical protein